MFSVFRAGILAFIILHIPLYMLNIAIAAPVPINAGEDCVDWKTIHHNEFSDYLPRCNPSSIKSPYAVREAYHARSPYQSSWTSEKPQLQIARRNIFSDIGSGFQASPIHTIFLPQLR
jgi:hypothetical protein